LQRLRVTPHLRVILEEWRACRAATKNLPRAFSADSSPSFHGSTSSPLHSGSRMTSFACGRAGVHAQRLLSSLRSPEHFDRLSASKSKDEVSTLRSWLAETGGRETKEGICWMPVFTGMTDHSRGSCPSTVQGRAGSPCPDHGRGDPSAEATRAKAGPRPYIERHPSLHLIPSIG
jgi:hypothetical protein